MDTRKVTSETRAAYWMQVVGEYQKSNQSVSAFCAQRGMKPDELYYRLRKLHKEIDHGQRVLTAASAPVPQGWIKLTGDAQSIAVESVSRVSSAWIVINGCWIEVFDNTSPELLLRVVKAVSQACCALAINPHIFAADIRICENRSMDCA
jgi:hypothetical protein